MGNTGYINGVVTGNISKVDTVPFANIANINTVTGYVNNPYDIPYSCRWDRVDSTYMITGVSGFGVPSPAVYTKGGISFWVKRQSTGTLEQMVTIYYSASYYAYIGFDASNHLVFYHYDNSLNGELVTTETYTSTADWMHIFFQWDTTQATAADRLNFWVDGSKISSYGTATYIAQNDRNMFGGEWYHLLGALNISAGYLDANMAEFHFIMPNIVPTVDQFGQTSGASWVPIEYTGNYGSNGFYYDFSDSADLGADSSGNANDMTATNMGADHRETDTPTS